jgi:hypothetical protein
MRMFKLMMPCGYPAPYRFEGSVGATPDTRLLCLREECRRWTLPPFLDGLEFNFVEEVPGFGVTVQNFYHLGDFFVVSDTIRDFLEVHAGCTFETKAIRTRHPNNEETEQFWAMKVTTRVDCILPDQSFAKEWSWVPESRKSFRELAQKVELSADIAPYFANEGSASYYSYPGHSVDDVSMDFSFVANGVRLFEPLYWPRYLVIDDALALQLGQKCFGRAPGYYFWTLDFNDIDNQYRDLMHALR